MSTLKANNLTIRFDGIRALNDFSVEVAPKSFVGLMGPNGAGKTTVINCISRIYRPQQGTIEFDGQDLLKLSGDQVLAHGISRTFQDLAFFQKISDMPILDYMKLGQFDPGNVSMIRDSAQTRRSKNIEINLKKRARRILELFREIRVRLEVPQEENDYPYLNGREGFPDLLDIENHPIGILSFAWRKRIDLARALVSAPKLLLLDEPAQGLAPSEIENLGKMLKTIQAELGVGALIVEHNVSTLAKISDKLIAMSLGEKIAEGEPEQVIADPKVIDLYLGSKSASATKAQTDVRTEVHTEPILELKNIDHYYGYSQVLFAVTLKVMPGQISTILGTNGSGKSTLLKIISGVEKPAFGEMRFKGEAMPLGWPEVTVERGIQFVPQVPVIFPELSVHQNLKIAWHIYRKRITFNSVLEKVLHYFPDLKPFLGAQAASLSGGQRRMLEIGQAIIGQPDLLLLDEPSLGLAPMFIDKLFHIIKRISEDEDCAVLLVEQDVRRALEVSDYIYMMNTGVLIAEGSKRQMDTEVIKRHLGFN